MTTTELLSATDHDALSRALAIERKQVDEDLKHRPWEEAAIRAAFSCQIRELRLRPWQGLPIDASDEVGDGYGCTRQEVELRQRMLAAGLSLYEPDPIAALQAAEAGAA